MKLRPEIKKRWVDALRSGQYKQGQNRLKSGDRFCCLGVLCDLSRIDLGENWDNEDNFNFKSGELPQNVMEWAGLSDARGLYSFTSPSLTELNDTGVSFVEIAGIIEKEF